jgi:transposase
MLTDDQWQQIGPLLPTDVHGMHRVDARRVISGILACAEERLPMVRLSAGVRPPHDDLQSLRAVGPARHLGEAVP